MIFPCTLRLLPDGRWRAEALNDTTGSVSVVGEDREQALDKLRAEIRYRLESCPCGGVGDDYVELEVQGLIRP